MPQPNDPQEHLRQVQELLARQRLVENLVHRQAMPRHELVEGLLHKQHRVELQQRLDALHPADIAYILEALPIEDRLRVWEMVRADRDGDILLEVSDAVRGTLIEDMEPAELLAAAEHLDADELADLAPDLPPEILREVIDGLDHQSRRQVHAAMSYPEDQVGARMDFDLVTLRHEVSLEVVLRYLRRRKALPDHTDKLFVIDRHERLMGILTLEALLTRDPERTVGDAMDPGALPRFHPEEKVTEAAQAFERYDLISAPVVDGQGRLIGRLTVADMVDVIRDRSDQEILGQAGLQEEEDIFAPVWGSVRNRWIWLAVNMATAILASRVIAYFEDAIGQLVALAALMPIVAGIGGNSGNQTITLIVRALATGQVGRGGTRRLLRKEVGVAVINGLFWGGFLGLLAWWLYGNPELGLVMTAAMLLNLLLAAAAGVLIPMVRHRFGQDPALGSSVLITALTDSGGFFIFLGLASIFLLG